MYLKGSSLLGESKPAGVMVGALLGGNEAITSGSNAAATAPTTIAHESVDFTKNSVPAGASSIPTKLATSNLLGSDNKYWKQPVQPGAENIVVIHVCDENRHVTKDFCCKRNILIQSMEYFEKFLAENENGYDDIDISVHCDVEIFEWLMCFIHEPDQPPVLEKSIVVSILISSEFLQMEKLVDLCIEHISNNLNDIIKLPIDLSCINEKLINKLAQITHPNVLAVTKDRKDKILNKLYKRRVELDFSRKNNLKNGMRSIASSLTCCRHCGTVYLDNYISSLYCKASSLSIDFRGRLVRRHDAIANWSLTAYLKALHAGGMNWESIYWHVWASCVVLKADDIVISALQVDKYTIEMDGIMLHHKGSIAGDDQAATNSIPFALHLEDKSTYANSQSKLCVSRYDDPIGSITPTLNPRRPPEKLTREIFELLNSQSKFISGVQHKVLLESTFKSILATIGKIEDPLDFDYGDTLWADIDGTAYGNGDGEEGRGRSRSPGRGRNVNRKQAHSVPIKNRANIVISNAPSSNTAVDDAPDSDNEAPTASGFTERHSRSSSMGNRRSRIPSKRGNLTRASGNSFNATNEKRSKDENKNYEEYEYYHGILDGLIPEVSRKMMQSRGPYYGIWMLEHPLQSHPLAQMDMIHAIYETNLSHSKKLEWELDVIREYDEKRMDRYELLLNSRRANSNDIQLRPYVHNTKNNAMPVTSRYYKLFQEKRGASTAYQYYKDRGRQPSK